MVEKKPELIRTLGGKIEGITWDELKELSDEDKDDWVRALFKRQGFVDNEGPTEN